jgi:hypothetical protein
MAAHDTTTSNVASRNGILRMSAVCTSTRPRTPSRTAFSSAASGRLPDRSSLCQMSMPVAVPVVSRRAAAFSISPRPHPTSSTRSPPLQAIRSSSHSRSRSLPNLLPQIIHSPPPMKPMKSPGAIFPNGKMMLTPPIRNSKTPDQSPSAAVAQITAAVTATRKRFLTTPGASIP